MSSSRLSTFFVMAYSICVLLLPWTTYCAASGSSPGSSEQSIASVYAAMAQPLVWEQKHIVLKGPPNSHKPHSPDVLSAPPLLPKRAHHWFASSLLPGRIII